MFEKNNEVIHLIKKTIESFGKIDILINNAGNFHTNFSL